MFKRKSTWETPQADPKLVVWIIPSGKISKARGETILPPSTQKIIDQTFAWLADRNIPLTEISAVVINHGGIHRRQPILAAERIEQFFLKDFPTEELPKMVKELRSTGSREIVQFGLESLDYKTGDHSNAIHIFCGEYWKAQQLALIATKSGLKTAVLPSRNIAGLIRQALSFFSLLANLLDPRGVRLQTR